MIHIFLQAAQIYQICNDRESKRERKGKCVCVRERERERKEERGGEE